MDTPLDSTAAAILGQIRALGYAVSIHRMRGGISVSGESLPVPDTYIEMHAVQPGEPPTIHVARVEGEGEGVELHCAVDLAEMVGIDLGE